MSERPYASAIEALKLCHAALERGLPAEERRVTLEVASAALMRLEPVVRAHDARLVALRASNESRQLTPEQDVAELARVAQMLERYRANLRGRFTTEGAIRWIVANSSVSKRRVRRHLKTLFTRTCARDLSAVVSGARCKAP